MIVIAIIGSIPLLVG